MNRKLLVVVSLFVMMSMSSELLQAHSAKTEDDRMLVTLDLVTEPQISQEKGAEVCILSNTTKAPGSIGLPEVLRGPEPTPAAPPWGCSNWGVCSIECWVSCFYNYECPRVDGQLQVCLCSGMCP
jgi:hypothetical protein